jgi:hypothetical protein
VNGKHQTPKIIAAKESSMESGKNELKQAGYVKQKQKKINESENDLTRGGIMQSTLHLKQHRSFSFIVCLQPEAIIRQCNDIAAICLKLVYEDLVYEVVQLHNVTAGLSSTFLR